MIDKGIYQTIEGTEPIKNQNEDIEVEVEIEADSESLPEALETAEEIIDSISEESFSRNLAELVDDDALTTLSSELLESYKSDVSSRKEWEKMYKDGLELLGLKFEERTEPWDGACGVYHPILTEAIVKFQAESITETFPASGPVKTKIIGKTTKDKEQAAKRVQDDMNYRVAEEMTEYRQEHERMLWNLPIAGCAFKKVYYDPSLDRQVSMFIPAEDFVAAYGCSDLSTSERYTHRMRKSENEIKKLQVAGFYRDIDLEKPVGEQDDLLKEKDRLVGVDGSKDERYTVLEMHVDLDLPGYESQDGIALPYVVTMVKDTGHILSIYRNYDMNDPEKKKTEHFVQYNYIPGFGFYGFGLVHLIGSHAKSATSLLRQLVDAGTLSNLPGGLKSRGLRIKGDETPIAPGEWRDVDVPGGSIRDNLLPLPYKEPSGTLYQLLNTIVEEGRRFAAVNDLKISDSSANAPVGTTLALLERSMKVMSAVSARIHAAMRIEFKLLKKLIREATDKAYPYDVEPDRYIKQADYDVTEVLPVSDPNASTLSQRVVQYQAVMQLAQQNPQLYDMVELNKEILGVLGLKNVDKLIPSAKEQKPKDPVSENMAIIMSKPVKAFAYQDHESHIRTHMSAMQDPKLAMLIGQNPNASLIQNALQAHVAEHLAYQYRIEVEKMMGTQLPDPEKELPPEVEYSLSGLVAEAGDKLLQKNQAEAQQQQAQQQAQDPVLQIQKEELGLKNKELDLKQKIHEDTMQMRAMEQQTKKELEKQRLASQERTEGAKLGAKVSMENKNATLKQGLEGAKLGAKIMSDRMKGNKNVS